MKENTDIRIRVAKQDDLSRLTEIYNQAILSRRCTCDMDTFLPEQRNAWFDEHQNEKYPLFVACKDEFVIGYGHLSAYRPGRRALAYVAEATLYLDFSVCSQEIGSALMARLIQTAKENGITILLAVILAINDRSIGLLNKFGFKRVAVLSNVAHIDDQVIDQYYYELEL